MLIHQPSAGFSGQATDIQIHARRSCARAALNGILAEHATSRSRRRPRHRARLLHERGRGKEYGLIDEIIEGHGRLSTNGSGSAEPAARAVNGGSAGPTTDGGNAATRN